ncbi:MAG: phasin family protein [Hyphomicrobiales bacterium]|nr:phasin family protein [Hyphomicrobiales bacterium]
MNVIEDNVPQTVVEPVHNAVKGVNREVKIVTNAFEKSVHNTGKGLTGLQLQVLDIMQTNIMAALDFTRKIITVKSFPEAVELQSAHMKGQMVAASAQAESLREAWSSTVSGAFEPMKLNALTTLQRGRIC